MLRIQKSHAAHIAALFHIFHWHIFPPPFPRAHSSEVKGREKKAEVFLFCWEWFRRALAVSSLLSSPTLWSWKEERHFLEEKARRRASSVPSCCHGWAGFSFTVCPCLSLLQGRWVLRGWKSSFTEWLAETWVTRAPLLSPNRSRQPWQGRWILPARVSDLWADGTAVISTSAMLLTRTQIHLAHRSETRHGAVWKILHFHPKCYFSSCP